MRPVEPPVGLILSRAARIVSRGFDEALGSAGGTLPVWLVLLNLTIRPVANQRELAAAIGLREATLTHHLNAMEEQGLVTRQRDPGNRRIQIVHLTEAGKTAFLRQREAAAAFDRRLRQGLDPEDLVSFRRVLGQLVANAGDDGAASCGPPTSEERGS